MVVFQKCFNRVSNLTKFRKSPRYDNCLRKHLWILSNALLHDKGYIIVDAYANEGKFDVKDESGILEGWSFNLIIELIMK